MSVIEIESPDGRRVRHQVVDVAKGKADLIKGYTFVGEVFGADKELKGGFVSSDKSSLLKALLDAHGDDLHAWLKLNVGDLQALVSSLQQRIIELEQHVYGGK